MARRKNPVNLLPPKAATAMKEEGRHSDGGGLYLQVKGNSRSWLFVFRWQGRRVEMGLGRAGDRGDEVSLAAARNIATDARRLLDEGRNPLTVRREAAEAAKEIQEIPTFGKFADDLIDSRASSFRNAKHLAQWKMTLGDAYCAAIRKRRVNEITTDHVLTVLQPVWDTKRETASRIRGRIEMVLDAAKAKGLRDGDNPALWRGHLVHFLGKKEKLQRGHHAAMPYREVPAFVSLLRKREGISAAALEFLILTASRSGEVRGAEWSEIDREGKVWIVPAKRMKAGKEHRVPLTDSTIAILDRVAPLSNRRGFVFPAPAKAKGEAKPMSDMVFKALFKRMEVEGVTTHGFRSSFRDWGGDATTFPRELLEQALAHKVGDEVEQAYRRSDALEKRRKLMVAWERFLGASPAQVIPINRAANL